MKHAEFVYAGSVLTLDWLCEFNSNWHQAMAIVAL